MSGFRTVKCGELKLNKSSLLSHKWQQKYCVLQRSQDKSPAVLEIAENVADHQADKKKDVSLDGVVSIESVQKFKEHPFAFEVQLKKDKQIFAVDDEGQLNCWVEAFRQACGLNTQSSDMFGIEENSLYESADQNLTYTVEVVEANSAVDLGLKGQYNLVVGLTDVIIYDVSKRVDVCRLPISKIRRYGVLEDGVFYMETGRRCPTGEGTFKFSTYSATIIAQMMKNRSTQLDPRPSSAGLADSKKNQDRSLGTQMSSSGKKVSSLDSISHSKEQPTIDIKGALEHKLSSDLKKKEDKKKKSSKEEQKKSAKELKSLKEEQQKNSKDKKKDKKAQDKKLKVLPDLVKPPDVLPLSSKDEMRNLHTYEDVDISETTSNIPQTAPIVSDTSSQTYNKSNLPSRQKSTPSGMKSTFMSHVQEDMYTEVSETVKFPKSVPQREQIYDEPDEYITSNNEKSHPPKPIPIPRNISREATRKEIIYDEPDEYEGLPGNVRQVQTTEVLYDQIDTEFDSKTVASKPNTKAENTEVVYSQPNKVKNAWQDKGRSNEVHEEHYEAIKAAAKSGNTKPVSIIVEGNADEDIYDQLAFKTRDAKPRVKRITSPDEDTYSHISCFAEGASKSGKNSENYDTVNVRSVSCSQDEVQRSSGGSNSSGYAEFVK